jgi:predicted adenine nucleotide alpha hydrolase (AANH) superfamily ATPase
MAETSASRAGKDAARNYRKLMDDELARIAGTTPTLLLHSCCAPCSTSVIAALSAYFRITVYYYNPNIDEEAEYRKRAREQERLLQILKTPNPVSFLEGDYVPEDFLAGARPRADDAEGGERCTYCYALRLERTAREAQARGFNYFTTTLSVSPMKDAERINKIGGAAAEKYGVKWLWSDFKKKDGYKKSIEMSKEYGLYRQNYCGCSYSRRADDHESS